LKVSLAALPKSEVLLLTATSFSLCAFVIDFGFLVSKLRVVEARNDLSDLALGRAKEREKAELGQLEELLHLSGEAPGFPRLELLLTGAWPIFSISLLFVTTPGTIVIVRAFAKHAGIELDE
jgi:hypothetical protein